MATTQAPHSISQHQPASQLKPPRRFADRAPAPRSPRRPGKRRHGSRFTDRPSTPPSAAMLIGRRCSRAIAAQRSGPRPGAPAWLAVGNAGDRNTSVRPGPLRPPQVANRVRRTRDQARARRESAPASARRADARRPAAPPPAAHRPPPPAPAAASGRSAPGRAPAPPAPDRGRAAAPPRLGRAAVPRPTPRGSGSRRSSVNSQSRGSRRSATSCRAVPQVHAACMIHTGATRSAYAFR